MRCQSSLLLTNVHSTVFKPCGGIIVRALLQAASGWVLELSCGQSRLPAQRGACYKPELFRRQMQRCPSRREVQAYFAIIVSSFRVLVTSTSCCNCPFSVALSIVGPQT